MNQEHDPFHHHPELRDKITDPLSSFFRTFRVESVLAKHPELEWVVEFLHSDDDREQSRQATLKNHPEEDLLVFAYGSLMWDPAFRFSEIRRAKLPDYSRQFILQDTMGGRGTREQPGLMAALDHGDGCFGMVFRIPHEAIDVETEILWRREVVAPGYIPTFVTAVVDGQKQKVLAFVADHQADSIRADISRDEQVNCLAHGVGIFGTSLEYLENIVTQFDVIGIIDQDCSMLLAEAKAHKLNSGEAKP